MTAVAGEVNRFELRERVLEPVDFGWIALTPFLLRGPVFALDRLSSQTHRIGL
jgi:hypothetical protein